MIRLDHLTIGVSDYRTSRDWYMQTLGLKQEFEVPERAAALQDDAGFTLFVEHSAVEGMERCCVLYFQVENVDVKYKQLMAQHVSFTHPPEKRFWGYGAELTDPDGYRLRLWDEKTMKEKGDA